LMAFCPCATELVRGSHDALPALMTVQQTPFSPLWKKTRSACAVVTGSVAKICRSPDIL